MLRAVLLMIVAMTLIPLGDAAGKALTADHGAPPVFVAWSRFALGVVLLAPFLRPRHLDLRALVDPRTIFRGLLITGGIISILTALRTEPLPNVFGAFFVGPILSFVLSALLLRETVRPAQGVLLAVGFLGVLLVVKPGFGMKRTFSVASPIIARISEMIQNRITICGFGPALLLEMVVDRGHQEHALAGALEIEHLDDDRQRLDHEEAADDGQHDLVLGATAIAPSAPPSASEPVSPMNTAAGGALYHRNPSPRRSAPAQKIRILARARHIMHAEIVGESRRAPPT
jgi:hypothetical protein